MRKIQKVWRISIEELEMQLHDKVTLIMSMTLRIADPGDWSKLTVYGREIVMEEEVETWIHSQELPEWKQLESHRSGRAALQGSVKPQSLGDAWRRKKERGAISWPIPSCQGDDTRRDAKMDHPQMDKVLLKTLCHSSMGEDTERGHTSHGLVMPAWWRAKMLRRQGGPQLLAMQLNVWHGKLSPVMLSCQHDEMLGCWSGPEPLLRTWFHNWIPGRGRRERSHHEWSSHASVMRCQDAKVDHHCSENRCTTAQRLTWDGADRGPLTNGSVANMMRCWDAKVDHDSSWELFTTAGHLTWEGAERGHPMNGLVMPT